VCGYFGKAGMPGQPGASLANRAARVADRESLQLTQMSLQVTNQFLYCKRIYFHSYIFPCTRTGIVTLLEKCSLVQTFRVDFSLY